MWRAAAALHNQQLETVRSWPVEQCTHHRKFGIITLLCVCLNTWFSYFKLHVTIFKRNNKGFILNTQVPKHVCINCGFRSKMSWYILFCWDPFWCNFILEFIGHSVMLLCASYLLLTPSSPCSLAPHLLWQLQLYISSDPHALTHWLQRRTLHLSCLQHQLFWLRASICLSQSQTGTLFLYSSPSSTIMPGTCILLSLLCKPQAPLLPQQNKKLWEKLWPWVYAVVLCPASPSNADRGRAVTENVTSPSVVTCGWVTTDLCLFFCVQNKPSLFTPRTPTPSVWPRRAHSAELWGEKQKTQAGEKRKKAASGANPVFGIY